MTPPDRLYWAARWGWLICKICVLSVPVWATYALQNFKSRLYS